jgi:hypothetical protein
VRREEQGRGGEERRLARESRDTSAEDQVLAQNAPPRHRNRVRDESERASGHASSGLGRGTARGRTSVVHEQVAPSLKDSRRTYRHGV